MFKVDGLTAAGREALDEALRLTASLSRRVGVHLRRQTLAVPDAWARMGPAAVPQLVWEKKDWADLFKPVLGADEQLFLRSFVSATLVKAISPMKWKDVAGCLGYPSARRWHAKLMQLPRQRLDEPFGPNPHRRRTLQQAASQ